MTIAKILSTAYFISYSFVGTAQTTDYDSSIRSHSVVETEKVSPLHISGSVDAYFQYNLAKQNNNFTSFTNSQNSFALGMASLKAEYRTSKTGIVIDLGFGPRQEEFAYNDDGLLQAVKQMYIDYSPAENLTFTAGTWLSHVGYESLNPQSNKNYSISYLFTYGPFTHTGLKASYQMGKSSFMAGISNETSFRIIPGGVNSKKFAIAQYAISPSDNVDLYFNYVGGQNADTSRNRYLDFSGSAAISKMFKIGANASLNSESAWNGSDSKYLKARSWWGLATYLTISPSEKFDFSLRSEFLNDDKNRLGFGSNIFANTLSANFKVEGLTLIPEVRIEHADKEIYKGKTGAIDKKNSASLLIAVVYGF